jgi:hypothetical protein
VPSAEEPLSSLSFNSSCESEHIQHLPARAVHHGLGAFFPSCQHQQGQQARSCQPWFHRYAKYLFAGRSCAVHRQAELIGACDGCSRAGPRSVARADKPTKFTAKVRCCSCSSNCRQLTCIQLLTSIANSSSSKQQPQLLSRACVLTPWLLSVRLVCRNHFTTKAQRSTRL